MEDAENNPANPAESEQRVMWKRIGFHAAIFMAFAILFSANMALATTGLKNHPVISSLITAVVMSMASFAFSNFQYAVRILPKPYGHGTSVGLAIFFFFLVAVAVVNIVGLCVTVFSGSALAGNLILAVLWWLATLFFVEM